MFIYCITNKINKRQYIGKTTRSIAERFYHHKDSAIKKNSQTHLHRSMRKYGIENFIIEQIYSASTNLELNKKEIDYISKLNPQYNMTKGGDGGDTSSSLNYKKAMSKVKTKWNSKTAATYGFLGKNHKEISKKKISKANSCPIMCANLRFDSIASAQNFFIGISVRKRINNPNFPNWFRLKPKRSYPSH